MMAIICRYVIFNNLLDFVIFIGMYLFVLSGLYIVFRDIKNRPGTTGNRSKAQALRGNIYDLNLHTV